MQLRRLSDKVFVSPQVFPDELRSLQGRVGLLINNRPDGEEAGQPSSAQIERAAEDSGLDYRHIPVVPGAITDEQVREFESAVSSADGPVLAYCRTGMRAASLWALSNAASSSPDAVLGTARDAGYDLSSLSDRIRATAAA